jgi:cyclophilin family peptidyl-prolyl cis-trans isomerase
VSTFHRVSLRAPVFALAAAFAFSAAPAQAGGDDKAAVRPPTADDLKAYIKDLKGKGPLTATIKTSMGDFHCELLDKVAPMTVANFIGLARGKHKWRDPKSGKVSNKPLYNGTIFHRVIPEFMIQGGDPLGNGTGGPGYEFGDETSAEAKHDRGAVLSMANAGPGTNGSQFFIPEVPTPHLDGKHTVFGYCEEVDLVKKIARVPTDGERPKTDVVIKSIEIKRGKAKKPEKPEKKEKPEKPEKKEKPKKEKTEPVREG